MAEDRKYNTSGWTLDTIERHLTVRIEALQQVVDNNERYGRERLNLIKESAAVALAAQNIRFEGVNEFRAALSDQALRLLPRQEYAGQHQNLIDKIDLMGSRITLLEGKSWATIGAYIIGAVGVASIIASVLMRH